MYTICIVTVNVCDILINAYLSHLFLILIKHIQLQKSNMHWSSAKQGL